MKHRDHDERLIYSDLRLKTLEKRMTATEDIQEQQTKELTGAHSRMDGFAMHQTQDRDTLLRHADRIEALEAKHSEPPDLSWYKKTFAGSVQWNNWLHLAEGYSDLARHAVDAEYDMYIATGDGGYKINATTLVQRIITAWEDQPNHDMTADLRMGMSLARLCKHDERVMNHCIRVLKMYELRGMNGAMSFRQWTQIQSGQSFLFDPPRGAWQGQQTAALIMLIETGYDDVWANNIMLSWEKETIDGIWGAGWEENDRYERARSTFKAGREVRLIDYGVPVKLFEEAWRRVRSNADIPNALAQHIDGHSNYDFDGAAALYEGWARLPAAFDFCKKLLEEIVDGNTSTPLMRVNQHPSGVRQAALCASLARVAARR